jgi:hypothetical protein
MTSTSHSNSDSFFLGTYRKGLDLLESSVVAAAEIPLSVASRLGVSDDTTKAVRDGNRSLVRGVYGGLGSIGDGVAEIAHRSGGYLQDAVGSAGKLVGSKS